MRQLSMFEAPSNIVIPRDAHIIVSFSGGKDSIASLLIAIERYGRENVSAHHQVILEDWPGTVEYCQSVCDRLGVKLYTSQAKYYGYKCLECSEHYLTARNVLRCPGCSSKSATFVRMVESVLDLVEWRKMWPSLSVRFCTSYFKRDHFNMWIREFRSLFGDAQLVMVSGERWAESVSRSRLPDLRLRPKLEWIIEWRPVLDYRRIEVFGKMREYGIEPHYCYKAQGMTDFDMYERDVEGGPRMSCVMCFLKSPEQLQASYQASEGRAIMDRALAVEQAVGHTLKNGMSLAEMIGVNHV